MPEIKISAEIASVTTINSPNYQGTIIKFWEDYEAKGQVKHRLWSAWFDGPFTHQVTEKDIVEITGNLSTSVGKYTRKGDTTETAVVNHNLNNCTLKVVRLVAPTVPATEDLDLPF
jgi:hypothetical protein